MDAEPAELQTLDRAELVAKVGTGALPFPELRSPFPFELKKRGFQQTNSAAPAYAKVLDLQVQVDQAAAFGQAMVVELASRHGRQQPSHATCYERSATRKPFKSGAAVLVGAARPREGGSSPAGSGGRRHAGGPVPNSEVPVAAAYRHPHVAARSALAASCG